MTDETKAFTSQIADPNKIHEECEAHRAQAIDHFGGHVHTVRMNQSSIPLHDDKGNHTGYATIVTTVWKKAPPEEVAPDADAQPQG